VSRTCGMRMCECADVQMCRCADVRMCGCADVQMCGCANVRMCGYAGYYFCLSFHRQVESKRRIETFCLLKECTTRVKDAETSAA
jgi:hypothetical protein